MFVTYEEKTYENYFNNELSRKSTIYFPFGQVQESYLGADSSAMSSDVYLKEKIGCKNKIWMNLSGVNLEEVAQKMNDNIEAEIKNIPSIKVNILLQYKRPQLINSSKGKEWHRWKQKYYRYDIYKKQQELLEKLDNISNKKALILYASPAIYDIKELIDAKINNTIIESTNFCEVNKLRSHHRNTYIKSGSYSIAFSEPERLNSFNLLNELNKLDHDINQPSTEVVLEFTSKLRQVVEKDPYIGTIFLTLLEPYKDKNLREYPFLYEYVAMRIFSELTGVQWLVSASF